MNNLLTLQYNQMDFLSWLINAISNSIVPAILSLGGMFLYYRQDRKSRELDNESKMVELEKVRVDEWRKLYDEKKAELAESKERHRKDIQHFKDIIDEQDEIIHEKSIELSEREVMIARLDVMRCECFGCSDRKPPMNPEHIIKAKRRREVRTERVDHNLIEN